MAGSVRGVVASGDPRSAPERNAPERWRPMRAAVPAVQEALPVDITDAYRQINAASGQVGGNGSFGPIYGEMTQRSMHRIVDVLRARCGMGPESTFIDIGAGLGKPSIHAAIAGDVKASLGV